MVRQPAGLVSEVGITDTEKIAEIRHFFNSFLNQ